MKQENRGLSSSEQYAKNTNKKLFLIGLVFLIIGLVAWLFVSEYKTETPDQTAIDFSTQDFDTMSGKKPELTLFPRGSAALGVDPKQVDMNNVVLGSKAESVITLTAKNAPILFLDAELAELQPDGFTLDSTCRPNMRLEADSSCNIKVLWNPVALRQIQNNLTIRWKEDSPSVFREERTTVQIKAQSTDSKDCVICEDVRKEAEKKPKMAMGLDGKLYEVDADGFVTIDGKKVRVTENGLLVDEGGNIVGVSSPDMIPIGLDNQVLGTISETQDVISPAGEKLGRLLGDGTIVDSSLRVLGAAVPVVSVMDENGNVIAKMLGDGSIVDSTNAVVGRPLVDKSVINLEGVVVGSLRPWGLVIDFNGSVLGGVAPDGSVLNANNQPIARVLPTGLAVNSSGELVGAVVTEGVAVAAGCQRLGTVLLNGQVKDSFEQIVGRILPDGVVVSLDNKEIGAVVSQGIVLNEKGMIAGFVNSEGKAVDAKGSVIGCLNPDGSVSAGKKIIGAVLAKGRIIGRACQPIGSVYPDGSAMSFAGAYIGRVMPDAYVKTPQNQIIGVVIPRGTAIAEGCRLLGLITINGQIRDAGGLMVGCVTPEKTVVNAQNEVIGAITPRGVVVSENGQVVGRIRLDGKVMDDNGNVIGCANPDGSASTLEGTSLGVVVASSGNGGGTGAGGAGSSAGGGVASGAVLDANGNPTGMSIVGNQVYDSNGNLIGSVQPNGLITDENGNIIGVIAPDGVVISPDGKILGRYSKQAGAATDASGNAFAKILPDYTAVSLDGSSIVGMLIPDKTTFMDLNNAYLGMLQIDGQLVGSAGETIGVVRADGTVVDKTGRLIGTRIPQGRVLSATGKEIGTVSDKGVVLSPSKTELGYVLGNGLALDKEGKILGGVLETTPVLAVGSDGVLGSVTYQGNVNDKSGRSIGFVTPFGLVIGSDGTVLGRTVRLGAFMDLEHHLLGWLGFDGNITSKSGSFVGRVSMEGLAFDKKGTLVGSLVPHGITVDDQGKWLSAIAPTSETLNDSGAMTGYLTASPYVYNGPKTIIGRVLDPGVAVDTSGDFLGWTRFDGAIENGKQVLGYVSFDNRVLTSNGNILGTYVPLSSIAQTDEGRVAGLIGTDGSIINSKAQKQGIVIGPSRVLVTGEADALLRVPGTFITDNLTGKLLGSAGADGSIVESGSSRVFGSLMINEEASNLTKQIVGGRAPVGLAIAQDLSSLGQSLLTGSVVVDGQTTATAAGTGIAFSSQGKIVGGVYAPDTFIGRDGAVIGTSVGSSQIMKNGRKVASYMPFGSALSIDTLWAGGVIPQGVAVTDDAIVIGTVAGDGAILSPNNKFMGRIMTDGSAIGVSDRGIYAPMPYVGGIAKQGLPLGYQGSVIGRTTWDGYIVDATDKKTLRILDDGTILGKETPLAGVVIPFGTAVSQEGDVLGSLNGEGKIVSSSGEVVGSVAINGAIKGDSDLKILGSMVPSELITNDCKVIGQPSYTGQVLNGRGDVVGRVLPDKWAVNTKGERIGRVTRSGLILSSTGDYLGRTMPDSTVVDPNGVNMGCARNDGSVVDNAGNVVGHVVERGPVFDENGNLMGRVKANGLVVDSSNAVIGKMLGDGKGTAVSMSGEVIGRVASRDDELIFNPDGTLAGTLALDGTYKDPEGNALFRVSSEGMILDPKTGRVIGRLSENGELVDEQGNPLSDLTLLRDKDGNLLGIVSGCDIINSSGQKIASIMPDGSILDLNGELFGTILGTGVLLAPDGSEMGKLGGTSTKLDRCGIKSISGKEAGLVSSGVGRRIFIGNRVFGITPNGSLVDEDGTVVGYMGEDGRPYSLDDKLLTGADSSGRTRPDLNKKVPVNSEQLQQMQQLLAKKREGMKQGIKATGAVLKPSGKVLARGKAKQDKDWGLPRIVSSWPVDMSHMILKDKAIPAVIVHSIDSRYSTAPVTAIVERHVYAEEGRNIIIPAGSRLIGSFSGSPGSDHVAKMEISWSRLIRPDGSAFQISGTSGDAQGRGGVAAYLSEELIQRYGKPVLTASVTSAIAYMTAVNDDITTKDNGDQVESSKSQAATSARDNFVDAMGEIFNQLLDEATNVKAVVFVPAGTRITVFAGEDLWLRSADDDEQDYEEQFGADGAAVQGAPVSSWVDNRGGLPQVNTEILTPDVTDESYYNPDDAYQSIPGLEDVHALEEQPTQNASSVPLYNGQGNIQDRVAKPVLPKAGTADRMF